MWSKLNHLPKNFMLIFLIGHYFISKVASINKCYSIKIISDPTFSFLNNLRSSRKNTSMFMSSDETDTLSYCQTLYCEILFMLI